MNEEYKQNAILSNETHADYNELDALALQRCSVSQASSPLSFFSNVPSSDEKAFIFKCFLTIDAADQLLNKENCRWLLRETKMPGVIALHYYSDETKSYHIRRYAFLENQWIVIGNDMDALERHLINTNPSSIQNHEQAFFERLLQDGFNISEPGFLAPTSRDATCSPALRSLSRGPSPF
jgi:hypothetical protein